MKGCYKAAVNCTPSPAQVTHEQITAERVDLYRQVQPLGENISVPIYPFQVKESVPTEDEIEWKVQKIQNNRSRGPSGMQAEHLKGWLEEARKAEAAAAKTAEEAAEATVEPGEEGTEAKRETGTDKELANWEKVVALEREDFGEGRLVEEAMCQAVVLIPKEKRDCCGIGLAEVVWKVVVMILNSRLTASITYHNLIYGFRAGHGTGTATL